ncbi:hypothetical protein BAE44_0005555 [Dichanthelium oligosanthes]|uniref:F-box domain-containing protein n=1 Tax=Dichanthelium oligosanthes TaxID=888268 RepID=A0A1E5W7N1_9POAL|nr:hypothetical protein BAE44_0005555 [Dichanthelium oligosanthes]
MVAVTATACLPDLPDDVITVILARVPDVVSLFRCVVVCKRWRGIVADPAFLRRCVFWPATGRCSLLGFFVQRDLLSANARSKNTSSRAPPVFVPAPGSALGPGRRFLSSFVRHYARILDDANPLAGRDGLLLLRVLSKSRDNTILRLRVCDLLTGKQDLLRPIKAAYFGDDDGAMGYAVLRAARHSANPHRRPADGYSTLFRVLIVGVHRRNRRVHLGEFSSTNPTWAMSIKGEPADGLRAAAAVNGSSANWLLHVEGNNDPNWPTRLYRIIDVGINTRHRHVRTKAFPPLPIPVQCSAWLCTNVDGDGRLSLILLARDRNLEIWTQQDANGVAWRRAHIHVNGAELGLSGMEPVCVAEKSGTMLVLYRSDPDNAYLLDIHSGSITMVAGWKQSLNYMTAVPCEINLLEFFMSRLGVQDHE